MALPPLTAEDRAAALQKAHDARQKRAQVKTGLKTGTVTVSEVLKDAATDKTNAKMPVYDLLRAMPGVAEVRARQIMDRLGIAESRRIGGLGSNQREALKQEFEDALV